MTGPEIPPSDPERVIQGLVADLNEMPIGDLADTTDPVVLEAAARLLDQVLNDEGPEITIRYPNDPDQIP